MPFKPHLPLPDTEKRAETERCRVLRPLWDHPRDVGQKNGPNCPAKNVPDYENSLRTRAEIAAERAGAGMRIPALGRRTLPSSPLMLALIVPE